MRNSRLLVIAATVVMIMAACSAAATPVPATPAPATASPSAAASSATPSSAAPSVALPSVKIGSDNFYESKLMAEIYSQILEHAGYTVDRHFGLGSRPAR
ncbi:MAG TPA: glycine betaine ABC transporter substrate-binding protein, partial [Candidatus Limnocylindrales bacterium]